MRKVYKVIQGTFHPTSRTFPPGGNAPDRSSDKNGGAFAAVSVSKVRLTDRLDAVPAVDTALNRRHRARFCPIEPARRRPMSLASGSAASTTCSSTPSTRNTWATFPTATGVPTMRFHEWRQCSRHCRPCRTRRLALPTRQLRLSRPQRAQPIPTTGGSP